MCIEEIEEEVVLIKTISVVLRVSVPPPSRTLVLRTVEGNSATYLSVSICVESLVYVNAHAARLGFALLVCGLRLRNSFIDVGKICLTAREGRVVRGRG